MDGARPRVVLFQQRSPIVSTEVRSAQSPVLFPARPDNQPGLAPENLTTLALQALCHDIARELIIRIGPGKGPLGRGDRRAREAALVILGNTVRRLVMPCSAAVKCKSHQTTSDHKRK